VSWSEYTRFRPAFAQILDPRFYTIQWLDSQVVSGKFRLFSDDNSAILVSIRTYPTGLKELCGEAATGNLSAIARKLIPQSIEWAQSIGCTSARIESRAGWAKAMKKDGFEIHQVAIRKDI